MSRWAPFAAFVIVALLALLFATVRVLDAYEWVAHTSDVRVEISRAIDATQALASDPDACERAEKRLEDVARLTIDNPKQQQRVERMRELRANACADAGSAASLVDELQAADATEIDLLHARRKRLESTATWALALFALALAGAILAAISAQRARAAALRTLAESEERFRNLAESATDLVRVHAPDGALLWVTPSCTALLGFGQEELASMKLGELLHPDERDAFLEAVRSEKPRAVTHRLRRKSGEYRWFETFLKPVFDDADKLHRLYTTSRDVDDRVAAEKKLEALAVTDELTGLHNRRGFFFVAGHEHRLATRQHRGLLLVFVDLDGLKKINDTLGHEQGDAAIRDFADVMRGAFRSSDVLARLGGDELVALAYDAGEEDAARVRSRLDAAIDAFNASHERPYRLAASVGCTVLRPGDERSLEELVAEADRTMYAQKRAKRGA